MELTKKMKVLYNQNHKILLQEIKEDINKWKHTPCSWTGRLNIVQMSKLLKVIYEFKAISVKISMTTFAEIENPS